jgi:hypothetical protein
MLHFLLFFSSYNTTPYFTTLAAILVNGLILLTWVKAKAFHIMIVATIFSVAVFSLDMTSVLGLTLLARLGSINEIPLPLIALMTNVFVIAPLAYKGLRQVLQLEEKRRTILIRRLLII